MHATLADSGLVNLLTEDSQEALADAVATARVVEMAGCVASDSLEELRRHWHTVRGGNRRDSHRVGYSLDVYEKIAPGSHGEVEYKFLHSEEVSRCTALTKQGKLCRNDAEHLSDFCKTHSRKT